MSCSTTTIVVVALISRINAAVCSVSSSLRPAAGSSSKMIRGSQTTTIPISTHWRWP
jgi:hypothetical protein